MRESLEHVPRKQWAWWLERHGYDASRYTTYQRPETTGLRLVGKYGRGPSGEVTGRDTLVVLTLGSEVALLNFARIDSPVVLCEIQLDYLPHQSLLSDSLLLTGGNGIQIWNFANPSQPVQLSVIPYAVGDFSIVDTFLYFIGNDTFFAYSFANPSSPHRIGFCRDSGYVTTATQNTAVLIQPNDVLGFVDVSNPSSPQHVGTWPAWPLAAAARGNLCCAAFADAANLDRSWFLTLDISDPANPHQLGRLDSVCGHDIYVTDSLAFVSGLDDGYVEFRIVNIVDSTLPRKLGTCYIWNDEWGVWADLPHNRAYIASEPSGLAVVDITNLSVPHVDTCVMTADQAVDVWTDGRSAYVADYRAGLRVLDVSDPTRPQELGSLDSVHTFCETVVADDSFAFASWPQPPLFRSILVSDPAHPTPVGGFDPETDPKDMVLRDTLVYLAGRLRFNVVNVARPRQPTLVGSCVAGDLTRAGLVVRDTLAYFIGPFDGLEVFSVANPTAPYLVNTIAEIRAAGCDVIDTLLYVGDYDDSLHIWSFANPLAPYQLSSVYAVRSGYGVAVLGRYAYVGCDSRVRVFDVLDARNPVEVGSYATPYEIRRVEAGNGYVYACCWEAGVSIFDTFQAGVDDRASPSVKSSALVVCSPVAGDAVSLEFRAKPGSAACVAIIDAVGRVLLRDRPVVVPGSGISRHQMDVGSLPAGVYIINVHVGLETRLTRFVKLKRR